MGCVLYTNNLTGATFASGAMVPFGSVIHRKGRAATLEGNEVFVRGGCNSYATMRGFLNCAATTEGEVTAVVSVDGTPEQSVTVTAAAAGDQIAIPVDVVLKGVCCGFHRIAIGITDGITLVSMPMVFETVD